VLGGAGDCREKGVLTLKNLGIGTNVNFDLWVRFEDICNMGCKSKNKMKTKSIKKETSKEIDFLRVSGE